MIPQIKDYERFISKETLEHLQAEAEPLKDKHILHMNSVSSGGGVAEILNSAIFLMNDLGIQTDWRWLKGTQSFYEITKKFHNALQGEKINLSPQKKEIYTEEIKKNSVITHLDFHDLVVIHDPQPLPMIDYVRKKQKWLWRCHIDLTKPYLPMLDFLSSYIQKYDGAVVSLESFKNQSLKVPQFVIPPAIDPLSLKNKDLKEKVVRKILTKNGIDLDKPILSLVSRFDKWKNHIGTLKAYHLAKEKVKCQLVFMGNSALDDPESAKIYDLISRKAKESKDITLITKTDDVLVNALQRASSVVYQMSSREGFGLTVSEALWKKTPVIAAAVGGLTLQVIDGKTGFIVGNEREAAKRTIELLRNDAMREELGINGKEHVRQNFLITRYLFNELQVFNHYLSGRKLPL